MDQRQLTPATGGQQISVFAPNDSSPGERTQSAKLLEPRTYPEYPLYDPRFEHDACGTGFVANLNGTRDHRVVEQALEALANLTHRGAMDADAQTSDGAGVLTQLPYSLLRAWLVEQDLSQIADKDIAVGMLFLPVDSQQACQVRAIVTSALAGRGAHVLGWRPVPTDSMVLGVAARRSCPRIEQVLVQCPAGAAIEGVERTLYLGRKEAEARFAAEGIGQAYVASLSAQTVVYKGLVAAADVARFYPDLRDPRYESAIAMFHQRYSTNTLPSWPLAQPLRFIAHNGEINTIQGNRHWMTARESSFARQWGDDAGWLRPICEPTGSDSTSLDNALELLTRSGRSAAHALTLLVPPAWEDNCALDERTRAFFQAQAPLVEPWDGPAALVFTDGVRVGAVLDRNGLRPLRYVTTVDGLVVVASEVGVIELDQARIATKGRLGPGQMLVMDTQHGTLSNDAQVKYQLAGQAPYRDWTERYLSAPTADVGVSSGAPPWQDASGMLERQALFGYTHEDLELVLRPMVKDGIEPVWSMGDDTPLSVLSRQPRPLSTYFRQRFAQVTNPPIDALREQLVMSLTTYIGPRADLLVDGEPTGPLLRSNSPVLDDASLSALITTAQRNHMQIAWQGTTYAPDDDDQVGECSDADDGGALRNALDAVEVGALAAAHAGAQVLVLSDREIARGSVPLPMPLAVAAVHHVLVREGLRPRTGLIVDTGSVWDVHQAALVIGYGANAVCPHLALATVRSLAGTRGLEDVMPDDAAQRYRQSIEKGLLKVMARMGLSVVESYLGAHLFEIIGVSRDVVDRYFPGTPSSLGGISLGDLARQAHAYRADAVRLAALRAAGSEADAAGAADHAPGAVRPRLADRGFVRFRRAAEYHAANPQVVKALQQVAQTGNREDYRRYADQVYSRPPTAVRDLLTFRAGQPISLDEVEPASRIVRRFVSTAMSLGALSPEAHLTLTLGVNRLGGRSNTGEGGEDPAWHSGARDDVSMNSKIKQIASARFGVTPAYLVHAEELEIKMAQGSKPGEGGQLPARKVTGLISRLRHTAMGIPLISPPPHHDIYSIEDLAQLIYDLKQVNPRAAVGVKLVAERGVGTVAAGVAKAHADYILISGHDGGTGASPLSSIKSVGSPWEVGLAEAQQVLRLNGLRDRVRLRTDGGLKTGRDVVVAAMLGADEFGFGTAALVALGCDMARQCHLDTCPTGIATQREDLRQRFTGRPEHIANFLLALAEEVREVLAAVGARTLDEVIGRPDLLLPIPTQRDGGADEFDSEARHLELSALLAAGEDDATRRFQPAPPFATALLPTHQAADEQLLNEASPLLERGHGVLLHSPIHNSDRAVGASLAGVIARRWGDAGLPRGTITCHYTGSAGQSFGAFCVRGLRLILSGDANDYVAKGMAGGEVVVMPTSQVRFAAHEQVIIGNTVLYGATGGMLLARGRAGERFAVRNSGAVAVVEGVGDHGCEYMTGGVVVVLGATGRNFGAGMSGGVSYVYDEGDDLPSRLNPQMVRLERITESAEASDVEALIWYHAHATQSDRAAALLANWSGTLSRFWRVAPQTGETAARPLADVAAIVRVAQRPVA